jgi:hypothetical protein
VAAPIDRSAWVWLHNRTPEFRAWQRHREATEGRDTPTDNRGGWLFPCKLPPLEAETPPKGQAHSSLEPLGFLRAVSANVVHNISLAVPKPARDEITASNLVPEAGSGVIRLPWRQPSTPLPAVRVV